MRSAVRCPPRSSDLTTTATRVPSGEREYGFAEPPEGEAPEVTLRLLATMEYVKETLAELDAEAAMLLRGEE
jgi:hypothetical protein